MYLFCVLPWRICLIDFILGFSYFRETRILGIIKILDYYRTRWIKLQKLQICKASSVKYANELSLAS